MEKSKTKKAIPFEGPGLTRLLKPCPFCGRKATLVVQQHGTAANPWYAVECNHCFASGPAGGVTVISATRVWNIREWNERKKR